MEQARAGKFFIKILLPVVVVVGLFFVIGWGVLYSSFLANNEQIILLRNSYFIKLGTLVAPGKLLYTIRSTAVKSEGEEIEYVYKLTGKVVEVDYRNYLLTIQDKGGDEWKFHFSVVPFAGNDKLVKLVINQMTVGVDGQVTNGLINIAIDPLSPDATQGLSTGDTVVVRWQDKRKADEMKGVIELPSDKVVPIARIVVEGAQ